MSFDPVSLFPSSTGKQPRPTQAQGIREVYAAFESGKRFVILEAPPGCHAAGEMVLRADGMRVRAEDVQVGDYLASFDGAEPRCVLQLRRGVQVMARVVPVKGEPFVVNLDHVLTLKRSNSAPFDATRKHRKDSKHGELVDVSVRDWFAWARTRKEHYKLVRSPGVGAFTMPGGYQPLDAYLLGLFLGDGAIGNATAVCKDDPEIYQALVEAVDFLNASRALVGTDGELALRRLSNCGWSISAGRRSGRAGRNYVREALRRLGLFGTTSHTKFVPRAYLTASYATRLALLAGLMDTDGSLSNGGYDFISASKQLADDVTFIARSVGLAAYGAPCEKRDQNGNGGTYHRVCISGHVDKIPTRIARKQAGPRRQKKDVLVTGVKRIELLPEAPYYGWTLDGDGRYLMGDFTLTHNCGKSLLAATLSAVYKGGRVYNYVLDETSGTRTPLFTKSAWFLTLTKALQDQYSTDPDLRQLGLAELKGRAAYPCPRAGVDNCRDGALLYRGKHACSAAACAYRHAKEDALASQRTVANYHSYAAVGRGQVLRELLVCDEAHELERLLAEMATLRVKLADVPADVLKWMAADEGPGFSLTALWPTAPRTIEEVAAVLKPLAAAATAICEKAGDFEDEDNDVEWLDTPKTTLPWCRTFVEAIEAQRDILRRKDRIIVSPEEGQQHFSMTPVYGRAIAQRFFDGAERVLLMSGTIDFKGTCKELDIAPAEAAYIQLPCTFPRENRPITVGNIPMMKKDLEGSKPKLMAALAQILTHHGGDKGLILVPSNALMFAIRDGLPPHLAARLLLAYGRMGASQVKKHKTTKLPTVLIASGMWEGLDLPGDLARFQVLPALPRAFLSDATRARMTDDATWYERRTVQKTIQGSMRAVRSETDKAFIYVLDRDFRRILQENRTPVPAWVREAVTFTKVA